MSNSGLSTYANIAPSKVSPRNASIDTISIHCVVAQWTAKQTVDYLAGTAYSCNYAVGKDGSVALGVDEGDRSICTSSSSNDNRAVTIEVASDTTAPYAVTDEALSALIALCADICQRNGIPALLWEGDSSLIGQVERQNMTVHRWFSSKECPGDYLYNLHGYIAEEVNKILTPEEEEEVVTLDDFKALWAEMRGELQDNDSSTWSQEARDWAVNNGLIQGSDTGAYMWEDVLTREQMAMLLYRFAQMMGQA